MESVTNATCQQRVYQYLIQIMNKKPNTIEKQHPEKGKQLITMGKKQRKQPNTKLKEESDVARTTPITDLITARRQLDEALRVLADDRNEMQDWSVDMKAAWEDLEKKELDLHDTFIRSNDFVTENYQKQERAKQKIEKEKEVQKQQAKELNDMEKKWENLKKAEMELNAKLQEYDIYRKFLQEVADRAPELNDVQGVLSRYETLKWTRAELGEQQANALVAVQTSREQLTKQANKQAQLMMGLHTQLADLRVRHDAARTKTNKWENILARVRTFAAEKAVEIEQVRGACWNLYKSICKLRKDPETVADWDTEHQLVYITRRIQQLNKVRNMVRDKLSKPEPATNVNIVTSFIMHP